MLCTRWNLCLALVVHGTVLQSGLAFVSPLRAHLVRSSKFNDVQDRGCMSPSQGCVSPSGVLMVVKRKSKGTSTINSVSDEDSLDTSAGEEAEEKQVYSIDKLKAEASAPFRKARLFLYGGFGASALIGGLTALSQLAATLSHQPGALELKDALINVGVDFAVVAAAGFCYKFEMDQQQGMEQFQAAEREKKKLLDKNKIDDNFNAERVAQLRGLSVKLMEDGGATREVPVGVLMDEAKQAFVVVAGNDAALKETMLSAIVSKNIIFKRLNVLIVPVNFSANGGGRGGVGGGKGFAPKPTYSDQGYVAEPINEVEWQSMMGDELAAAERQGAGAEARKDGIVLVVSKDSKVLRRGVGTPVWKIIKDDINPPPAK